MARKAANTEETAETVETVETEAPTERNTEFDGVAQRADPPTNPKAKAEEPDEDEEEDEEEGEHEIDLEELQRLRAEAAKASENDKAVKELNKQLRALQKQIADAEREKLSQREREKLELKETAERAAMLERDLRQTRAENAIAKLAGKYGLAAEDAIDLIGKQVEFDDDGKPSNIDSLLSKLQKIKSAGSNPPSNPSSRKREKVELGVDELRGMSEDQINENWGQVQAALRNGGSGRRL